MKRIMALAAACLMIAAAANAAPTFSRDIAPILFKNCAACHRPGEVAPMSLLDYKEARPWAKSIRKAVLARTMPPWGADSKPGQFRNDLSLTDAEIETLTQWVDAGAPEGDAGELPPTPEFKTGWTLGEPDYIIEFEETRIPAQGEDLFPSIKAHVKLPEDRWVRAIEFAPGDKRVVHHILTILGDFSMSASAGDQASISEAFQQAGQMDPPEIFQVWVAGAQPTVYPEGMGRLIKKDQIISMNVHYHPCGVDTVDRSRIGLYFGEGSMKKTITTSFAVNTGFLIPPGEPNHPVEAFHLFDQDSRIVSFMPHMHVRGKDMRYDLVLPGGARRTVLNVPRYNYNWQWIYYPSEPIAAPKGSRIEVVAHYDNSKENPDNPDPTQAIQYRDATVQEMFVAFMEFISDEGVAPAPAPPMEKLSTLLAAHEASESYIVQMFLTPVGLHIPKKGDGMMYVVAGNVMFTSTLRDVSWDGNRFRAVTSIATPSGGGMSTVISGALEPAGILNAKVELGVEEAAADPEHNKVFSMLCKGRLARSSPPPSAGGN